MTIAKYIILILGITTGLAVVAQQQPVEPIKPPIPLEPLAPPAPPSPPEPPDMAEIQKKLKEAQLRMEEAVRDVTRYSTQYYTQNIPDRQNFIISRMNDNKGAMLGVHVEDVHITSGVKDEGVVVVGVTPNGPAAKAGLQSGDLLLALNGEKLQWKDGVSPCKQLLALMSDVEPEQPVNIDYERNGDTSSVVVNTQLFGLHEMFAGGEAFDFDFDFDADLDFESLEEQRMLADKEHAMHEELRMLNGRFGEFFQQSHQPWYDLELLSLTPKLGRYFDTDKGLLVVSTSDNKELKLEEGDVILDIDGREPKDPAHAMHILTSYQAGETVTLRILREKRKRNIEIKVEEKSKKVGLWFLNDDQHHPETNKLIRQIKLDKNESI